jgi:hypothetical protein
MRTAHSLRQRLALIASDEDCTRLRWCCRGRREDPAPIAAVEEVLDRLALRLKAKPSAALPCRGNPQIRDKFALSRRTLRALRHNQRRLASGAPICSGRRLIAIALLIQARTYHFTLHSVIERRCGISTWPKSRSRTLNAHMLRHQCHHKKRPGRQPGPKE